MSKTIVIKRSQLPDLLDAYGKVSTAHICDADISIAEKSAAGEGISVSKSLSNMKDRVDKVKYAAGKNYNRLMTLAKKRDELVLPIECERDSRLDAIQAGNDDPEIEQFQEKRIALCEKLAQRDANGQPVMKKNEENELREYVIANKNKKEFKTEIATLRELYADALSRAEEHIKDLQKQADEIEQKTAERIEQEIDSVEVEVELHQVPWENRPSSMSGAYVALVAPMFTGAPSFDSEEDND